MNFSHVINANMICTGVTVSKKYSADEGINPDVVLVGIGVETTTEIIVCGRSIIISINVLNEYSFSRDRWSSKEGGCLGPSYQCSRCVCSNHS